VLPKADGTFELVMDEWIDERLGVYVRVPSEIRAGTLNPAKVTLADGKRAYQFLADEWLIDVECDNDAKAVLISIALTLIQRMLFKERPGFMVTGPVAGAGRRQPYRWSRWRSPGTGPQPRRGRSTRMKSVRRYLLI
jgi:hypothetical protein